MNFKKINNITGWVVCLIACTTYILTAEAGGSLWDCGEFVSSCFKLQIPHPPGAPLFVLLGRVFIVLFGGDALHAAKAVNIMSALASGFSILFLFWSITHFARRIVHTDVSKALTGSQIWSIMGAGAVGALAYTFSDSFWYSAVEGEVYAMSSFFTAIVFWAILKWEHEADKPAADKWIVFIFFMMGLSIGVHLLNLLTIPAIVMVYYFRRKEHFNYKVIRKYFVRIVAIGGTLAFIAALVIAKGEANEERNIGMDSTIGGLMLLGTIAAIGLLYLIESLNKAKKEYYGGIFIFFVIGCAITGIVQVAVIQYSIKGAGAFDVFFKNKLGLPFFSGFVSFFVLVALLVFVGLRYASKKNWQFLRLGIWCFTFMLIGYSTYLTTLIRSNANTSVDMYNVDNPMSLVGYLGREQYGDFPLLYGQKFTAQAADYKKYAKGYVKGQDKYIDLGEDYKPVYAPEDKLVFPRVWDASNDQQHANYYSQYLGIQPMKDGSYDRAPTQGDNISFFVGYQTYFMYFRYFMWNFSGKQNDVQGSFAGNIRDGNWITGISFIDNAMYGNQDLMPDSMKNNKAHNKLFMLPFILGMIGLFYHFIKKGSDALVNMLLFFFTGMAIVMYLNQAGNQPRERDYAYVGSFYAFAVWIGLSVTAFIDFAQSKDRKILYGLLAGCGIVFASCLIASFFSQTAIVGIFISLFIVIVGVALFYLFRLVHSITKNAKITSIIVSAVCLLAVPALMASQEWDDHDRSKKQLARDLAKDYLESCPKNAILFSFGDNDTYPLWYAQEVEGIRTDIRVINYSLLGIDWYINELRYKVNDSDPIDVIWTADQIEGRKRDYAVYQPNAAIPENRYYDLYDLMKNYVGSDDRTKMQQRGPDEYINTFPVKKVSVPVDMSIVRADSSMNVTDSIVKELRFDIPRNGLMKNDLAVLNIIAANHWQRPICFTSPLSGQEGLGFDGYLRRDGLTYRLVPVYNDPYNMVWMTDKLMNKFAFGSADIKGVYYDEENRRHLNSIRSVYAELAIAYASKGQKEEARKVLNKVDKMMLEENFPYGMSGRFNGHNRTSLMMLEAAYNAEDKALAEKISKSVRKDLQQQVKFYQSLEGQRAENMQQELQSASSYLRTMDEMEKRYTAKPASIEAPLKSSPIDTPKK